MSSQNTGSAVLDARTASDLMNRNPISIHRDATVKQALSLFAERRIGAAPVIDDAGRAVGVVSVSDITRKHANQLEAAGSLPEYYQVPDGPTDAAAIVGAFAETPVRQLMTPIVFCVTPTEPAVDAVRKMTERRIHRIFVVDDDGVLVGVISALDVLAKIRA